MANKDSFRQTVIVALLLCVVCSIVVSGAAVILKPIQTKNKLLDRNKNILAAAGLYQDGEHDSKDVQRLFDKFEARMVDISSGKILSDDEVAKLGLNVSSYDQRAAAKDPSLSHKLDRHVDIASIKRQANYSVVYLLKEDGKIKSIVLPVHGYGLWGTLYGYIALEGDANTVIGLGFYEHKETPGLGAKVDTLKWKSLWPGKEVYADNGDVAISVIKGAVDPNSPKAIHQVDGLSGASLTSAGVDHLLKFWLGENGFGPLLKHLQTGGA